MPKVVKDIDDIREHELMSIPEACKYLNIGRYSLTTLFCEGMRYKVVGTQRRTTKKWINQYLNKN